MRKYRKLILIGFILCSVTACGSKKENAEKELGSVAINKMSEDRFGTFKYSYSVDKDGNTYTVDTDESFTVSNDEGSIKIAMTDSTSGKTVDISLISTGEDDLYQATMSNDGTFRFVPSSLEWIITVAEGDDQHYQKVISDTISRSDVNDTDVSFGADYINIPEELIPNVVKEAEDEGINYYYADKDSDISVVLLPIPDVEGKFNGTHAFVWLLDGNEPGDVAILYFDGSYGTREASVIGERRNYTEEVFISENRIDDFEKDEEHPITEDSIKEIMQGYIEESEAENE